MIIFLSWSRLCLASEVADYPSRHSASRQLRRSTTTADLVALALKLSRFFIFPVLVIFMFYFIWLL
jgi:hypothetical protein